MHFPNGEAYYVFQIKNYTTTKKSAEEIHRIGLNEVIRIRNEMDEVIAESGFQGSFKQFVEFLRTNPDFYYSTAEELLEGYQAICKKADPELVKLFGVLPRMPYGVKPIPDYQAPASPTAYYYSGSKEGNRPGYFWANTYKIETRPKYEMEALSLHEAVPGHHLQISLAQELENVPEFRKHGGFTAFTEGWGLYSEKLGEEMGFYQDPYSKFGQLTYEMWRACRLVVDTGIHAFGWPRDKAIKFMLDNTAKTENDVTVEIDRYIAWPGQALAYKIGELKIRELRKKAEDDLGERFNIRDFHDIVLGNGSIPLDLLEEKVNQHISSVLESEG
jgi:prolyl oligopeptidase